MSRTKRKPESSALVRDSILDSATRVFGRKGMTDATMKEIAADAGYTAASLYNYFESKDALFSAIVTRAADEIAGVFDSPPAEASGLESRIVEMTGRLFAIADRRKETFRLLDALGASASATSESLSAQARADTNRRVAERVAVWLCAAAENERIGRLDATGVAMVYLAIARSLRERWKAEGTASPFAEKAPLAVELFLYGVSGARDLSGALDHSDARSSSFESGIE